MTSVMAMQPVADAGLLQKEKLCKDVVADEHATLPLPKSDGATEETKGEDEAGGATKGDGSDQCGLELFDKTPYKALMTAPELSNPAFAGVDDLRKTNYYFCTQGLKGTAIRPGTMRHVCQELRNLAGFGRAGLELSKDVSMFVRCDEEEPQFMRAIVTGVSRTPYEYGTFLFDIYLPNDYPNVAPKCIHITPGTKNLYGNHTPGGMSPNLHSSSGKVCLSLLGTWSGPGWNPKQSSVYQLLTAISFSILAAEEPYYMEPSYGGWEGTAPSTPSKVAITYKEEVQRGTLQYGIIGPLENILGVAGGHTLASQKGIGDNPWEDFREVLLRHFVVHRCDIVRSCLSWFNETECVYHKNAVRWLTVRTIELLAMAVGQMTTKAEQTAFAAAQLGRIATEMLFDAEQEAEREALKESAKEASHPTGNSKPDTPWKSVPAEAIFGGLMETVTAEASMSLDEGGEAVRTVSALLDEVAEDTTVRRIAGQRIADCKAFADKNPELVSVVEAAAAAVMDCQPRYRDATDEFRRLVAAEPAGAATACIARVASASPTLHSALLISWVCDQLLDTAHAKFGEDIKWIANVAVAVTAQRKSYPDRVGRNAQLKKLDKVWLMVTQKSENTKAGVIVDSRTGTNGTRKEFQVKSEDGATEWVAGRRVTTVDLFLMKRTTALLRSAAATHESNLKADFAHIVST